MSWSGSCRFLEVPDRGRLRSEIWDAWRTAHLPAEARWSGGYRTVRSRACSSRIRQSRSPAILPRWRDYGRRGGVIIDRVVARLLASM